MADLASSFSSFMFPEGFQPLDGCDELDSDTFLKSSLPKEETQTQESISFQRPQGVNSCLDIGQEVAITMEPDDIEITPSTPNKPPTHLSCLSPLTPTANLKVLMSAASPEIRGLASKRQKKALFNAMADHASSLQLEQGEVIVEEEVVDCFSQGDDGAEDSSKPINRKSKSLGLLCQRFLSRYPDYPENGVAMAISLDVISKDLGVERRRIYDIVNVLESIEMVSRLAKNKYQWHGKMNLEPTLARLKCLGEKKRYSDQIVHLKKLQVQNEYNDELENLSKQPFRDISNLSNRDLEDKKEMDKFDEDMNSRRDKSLGVMSQKFIMLFLVSQAKVITLDIAARVLIGDINYEIREGSKFKTKVRRLYDIANILTSLEMIQKVHVQEGRGRKPAFRWIGPNPDTSHVQPGDVCMENTAPSRQSFFSTPAAPLPTSTEETTPSPTSYSKGTKKVAWSRHASFNAICEVVERERRSYSSAPNSPVKNSTEKQAATPIEEKFRQDFQALCSKYPDQMSKICVSEKESGKEMIKERQTAASRDHCMVSVPVSSPKCTPGSTAGLVPFNKVIVSPIPGSLPVGNSHLVSSPIAMPLSFNVVKSVVPVSSQDIIPHPTKASIPSPSGAKHVLDASKQSFLNNTVNAVHMLARQPDTTRRSKRVIKQPASGEFEYQPMVKRSKMELEAVNALKRSHYSQQLHQPQMLTFPVDGNLVKQSPGKPMQTIIIRTDVSVLSKNNNSIAANGSGQEMKARPTQGTLVTSLVPGSLPNSRQQVVNQHLSSPMTPRDNASQGRVTAAHINSRERTPFMPRNILHSSSLQGKDSPELRCHDMNVVGMSAAQLAFNDVAKHQSLHCQGHEEGVQAKMVTHFSKKADNKGLKLDISNERKTGNQRNSKVTNDSIKQQGFVQGQLELTSKCGSSGRRSSVARALHLCPEFRNTEITQAADMQDCASQSESTHLQNEVECSGLQPACKIDSDSRLNRKTVDLLAWPLHNRCANQDKPTKMAPSKVHRALDSESMLRCSRDIVSSIQSLPESPLLSPGVDECTCSFQGLAHKAPFGPGHNLSRSQDVYRLPHANCLAAVQKSQPFPSIPTSDYCLGYKRLAPHQGSRCFCRRLSKLSVSSLASSYLNGSTHISKTSQTRPVTFPNGPANPYSSIPHCQQPYNRVISRPMCNLNMSPLAGSFFNPLPQNGSLRLVQADGNVSSPILAQSQEATAFTPVPMVLASPAGSEPSSFFGYPIFQSTPITANQFLSESSKTPVSPSVNAASGDTCK